jgi:hypothetical protein
MDADNKPAIEKRSIYQRRWFKWLTGVLLVILLLLVLLPMAVQYTAVYLLKEQGFQQVRIGDVDLNLFSGGVGLSDVIISGDGQGRATLSNLQVNLSMLALLKKRIEVESLQLDGITVDLENRDTGQWSIAGFVPPKAEQATAPPGQAEPWGIGVDQLQINNVSVHVSMPKLESTLTLDALQLRELASWLPQQTTPYSAELHINETPLRLTGQMQPFKAEPRFQGLLELTRLPLVLAATYAQEAGVERLGGSLSVESEFYAVLADQPSVQTKTNITLDDLALQYQSYAIDSKNIFWQGKLDYAAPEAEPDLGVRLNGVVAVSHLAVQNEGNQFLQLAGINVHNLNYDGKRSISIDDIMLGGLQANITINKDGKLNLVSESQTETAQKQTEAQAETADEKEKVSAPWQMKLARFEIADDSHITFDDMSVDPAFHADITPLSLTVTDIDTAASKQPVNVSMRGTIDKHEQLEFTATVLPFGEKLNMNAKGKLTAFELPPVSAYVNREMGYYLKRGQLNSSLDMTVKDDQLKAKINARLNKFNIEEGDPARAKSFSEKLSMPLDAALELLRDKDDNIKLDVTIEGDIHDPQFDISKVINKAIANATKMAVTGYLKFMLQPWGAMLMAVEMVGESGGAVNLQPIEFAAGESQLGNEYEEYLGKIAKLMQERPKIVLNICGVASEQDRQALQQPTAEADKEPPPDRSQQPAPVEIGNDKLLNLAIERGNLVKEQLIGLGVDAKRLFTCHPEMEGADKQPPQVKLSL